MKLNISELAKNLSKDMKSKDSNRMIRRGGSFEPGTYSVTIAAVDTAKIESGQVTITFEAAHSEQHKQVLWLENFAGDGLSDGLEALLFGLFGASEQSLLQWLGVVSEPSYVIHAFQMLRGMKLTVTVGDTEGFVIVNKAGKYYAVNNKTDEQYCGPFARRILTKRAALAQDLREPKSVLLDAEPTHDDENIKALQNCIKAITNTEAGGTDNEARLEAVK
jgi:hypothetical protein